MGTHRLRRSLARASVVSLCAAGVIPLSSGTANAAPPAPREFDTSMLTGGPASPATLQDLCDAYSGNPVGTAVTVPAPAEQAAFEIANDVKVQFDDNPLPPLGLVSAIPLLGPIVGPPAVLGLGGSLLGLEIVDQVTKLDLTVPSSTDDVIILGDGDNVVLAGAGNDYVCAGAGGDIIDLGSGDDEVIGADGEDVILGGSGDDNGGPADTDDILCYLSGGNNLGC